MMETGKYLGKRQSVPARVLCADWWIPKEGVGWERCQVFDRASPASPECFAVVHPLQSLEGGDSGVFPGNANPKPSLTPVLLPLLLRLVQGQKKPLEQGIALELMDVRVV